MLTTQTTTTTSRMITKHEFLKAYTSPGSPFAFSSPNRVFNHFNGSIPINKIKKWLQASDAYTLHRQPKAPKPRNPTYVYYKRYQFQIDLIEIGKMAKANDNYRYLLTAIDIFSRYAFVEPLKDKTALVFLKGFKTIIKKARQLPRKILADRGLEIKNKFFKDYCRRNGITLLHSDNFVHAPFVERFNRSLKSLMFKYMTSRGTDRFIHVLQSLVKTYNSRVHRMIGMSPAEAEKAKNASKVRMKQEEVYGKIQRRPPKFKKGQTVRISKYRAQFDRGYDKQFTEEIFKIRRVFTRLPIPTYELETLDGDETIEGNFYANELTSVKPPKVFDIEKIVKRKKDKRTGQKLVLVKWKGYKNLSWIAEDSVIDRA